MASLEDTEKGAAALKAYVASINGWQADFVPWGTYENGARLIVNKWDSGAPANSPTAQAFKKAACGMQLYQDISDAGYANRVTTAQCAAGANAVLIATGRIKG